MKKLLETMAIVFLAARLSAQTNAPVRLALVAETGEAAVAADVLTAQLSRDPKIQLLERNEIEKVYREQGLSAANKDYLKLGRILGADGLLLLETFKEGAHQFLNSRLVAVKPAVVLTAERFRWPLEDVTNWVAGFVNHLQPLFPKLTVLAKDAVPISVVNLRSAVQSTDAQETERQLTLLAIERLSRERQVFVLERRKMQLLSGEKELAGMDESTFWNGSYLLEGTIDRVGYAKETVTISARLVPPQGGTPLPIEVSGSRTNFSEVINQLTGKVLKNLKLTQSGPPWNPADEAIQYFDEAKWALRLGLYEQAQAASESAWALGKRTKDVAILRVRAYGENVLQPENASDQCSLHVPPVPDESKLKSASRALEIFCQDAPRTATNPAALDLEWFDMGLQTLRMAARFLEGFYYTAETRHGNEEQLAELRSWARQAAKWLRIAQPDSRKVYQDTRSDWLWWNVEQCRTLEWLIWEESGIWHEKPEDALPAFKELLENGYHPEHLPRVIGWSWEDRKRVPNLLRRFIDELCVSTNAGVRIEARYLALLRSPDATEGDIERHEARLFSEIWDQRESVLDDPGKVSVLPRTERAMRDKKYDVSDLNSRLDDEPLIAFVHRLRIYYLTNASTDNARAFRMLFPNHAANYSQPEARELLPLIEDFGERVQPQKPELFAFNAVVAQLQRIAGTNTVVARRPTPSVVWPAENPLEVNFVAWKLKRLVNETGLDAKLEKMIVRGGKIWSSVYFSRKNMSASSGASRAFVQVDPVTGDSTEIPNPFAPDEPPAFVLGFPPFGPSFEVTGDSLYASSSKRLMRFRFREKAWEEVPVPVEGGAEIIALGNRLYLAARASLLELDPGSGAVQVLASSRRRPAANELDTLWRTGISIFTGWQNKLGVQTPDWLFLFDPDRRGWEKIAVPESLPRQHMTTFLTGQGIQLLGWDYPGLRGHVRMFDFSPNHPGAELLLKQGAGEESPASEPRQTREQPRWNWPDSFRLDFPLFIPEGQTLWMMHPRELPWPERLIKFQDGRHATLLHFKPGIRDSFSLPLAFRKDGQPIDPFNFRFFDPGFPLGAPFCLVTDQGLVVACPALAGHWLVPRDDLQSRLKPVASPVSQPAAGKGETVGQSSGNASPGASRHSNLL